MLRSPGTDGMIQFFCFFPKNKLSSKSVVFLAQSSVANCKMCFYIVVSVAGDMVSDENMILMLLGERFVNC